MYRIEQRYINVKRLYRKYYQVGIFYQWWCFVDFHFKYYKYTNLYQLNSNNNIPGSITKQWLYILFQCCCSEHHSSTGRNSYCKPNFNLPGAISCTYG